MENKEYSNFTAEGLEEIIKHMDYMPDDREARLNLLKALANALLM